MHHLLQWDNPDLIEEKAMHTKQKSKKKNGYRTRQWLTVLATLLLLVSFLVFFAARWYRNTYGNLGFDSILYTVFSDLGGVQSGLILDFGLKGLLPAVV